MANAVCTQIGDARFDWFGTTSSKRRLNFLELLQAGSVACSLNDAALDYMAKRGLMPVRLAALREAGTRRFDEEASWVAFAVQQGITAATGTAVDPFRIATEGISWGYIAEQDLLDDTVILSDDAGQLRAANT